MLGTADLSQLCLRTFNTFDQLGGFVGVETGACHLLQLLLGFGNILLELLGLACRVHKARCFQALVQRRCVCFDQAALLLQGFDGVHVCAGRSGAHALLVVGEQAVHVLALLHELFRCDSPGLRFRLFHSV